jgi:hypothetical protein
MQLNGYLSSQPDQIKNNFSGRQVYPPLVGLSGSDGDYSLAAEDTSIINQRIYPLVNTSSISDLTDLSVYNFVNKTKRLKPLTP